MSQPPPGGYPPPDDAPDSGPPTGPPGTSSTGPHQSPAPGAYPPPPGYQQPPTPPPGYQQGPPPGYQQGPPQGPPPGYQQGPPPGYQQGPPQGPPPGYQQGPPPGYQQGPPPGYQQGPPPGYQQGPPPGAPAAYGPPGAYGQPPAPGGYGPPGAYPPPGGAAAKPSFDPSKVTIAGWGVLGASLLTLIASFFSFWSVSYSGIASVSVGLNGWSSWWFIPILLAIAVGVIYALQVVGVLTTAQVKPEWLAYGAAASFILIVLALIQTFFYTGGYGSAFDDIGLSYGPSFGIFLALITTAALTYFTALAAQGAGAKLPFKVPGPA